MKKLIALFFTICTVGHLFAQKETDTYRLAADSFELHYNTERADLIFARFSAEMQESLPIEKTTAFITGLKKQVGKITGRSFIKNNGTFALYKTTCERALVLLQISINDQGKISGLLVKPYKEDAASTLQRNKTKLLLPFKDEWTVIWGGDTKELNYHVENEAQKNAFDMVITNQQGQSFKTDGNSNEDYYAFGKELLAPCDGEVVLVVDGVKDNKPGVTNPVYVPGNTVIIKTANNEYLFFAHFKQHSIVVKQGQKVAQGQLLGHCGNSGNSSEPHLHFHIQNIEDMVSATGIKCYFDQLFVNGKSTSDYSPIQKDKIRNTNK